MANISLNTTSPSFEEINNQLKAYVDNKQSWLSLKKSATGTLLLDSIGAIGEFDQISIQNAVQETTLENAHIPESIYTNCRFLGVHLDRKTPAQVDVTLQNSDLNTSFLEIPIFSQFSINGIFYFNRTSIVLNGSNPTTATIYQGEIKSSQFVSTGLNYQTYLLEDKEPWTISNNDIICVVGTDTFYKTNEPIFLLTASDTKFYENTLPDGLSVEIKFGNGVYGKIPSANSLLTFKYAVTKGSSGNNTLVDLKVDCSSYPSVVGETISNTYGGGEQPNLLYYQMLGSIDAASNDRGIDRGDFKSLVVKYPGIIDCNVYGQAEIAPNSKDWMNVVGLMILTSPDFNADSFKGLVRYLKSKSIFGFQFKRFDPEPVYVDIKVTLYMKADSDLNVSVKLIEDAIKNLTNLQLGSLGRSLYTSDLEDTIFSTLPKTIDYIEKPYPQIDFVINKNQYIVLNNLIVNAQYSTRDSQAWINPLNPYNT